MSFRNRLKSKLAALMMSRIDQVHPQLGEDIRSFFAEQGVVFDSDGRPSMAHGGSIDPVDATGRLVLPCGCAVEVLASASTVVGGIPLHVYWISDHGGIHIVPLRPPMVWTEQDAALLSALERSLRRAIDGVGPEGEA